MATELSSQHQSPLPTFTFLQLLSNSLVLYQTVRYLPLSSLLALGATSLSFRRLIYDTPSVFQQLDLTPYDNIKGMFADQHFSHRISVSDHGPLDLFGASLRQSLLRDVQVLILDGLEIHGGDLSDIILRGLLRVRILSIRDVKPEIREQIQQILGLAMNRSAEPLQLRGLYVFRSRDSSAGPRASSQPNSHAGWPWTLETGNNGVLASEGAQIGAQIYDATDNIQHQDTDKWYQNRGRVFHKPIRQPLPEDWASLMVFYLGAISFDAVLCSGPRHSVYPSLRQDAAPWYTHLEMHLEPEIATHAVGGCSNCHTAPEGYAAFGESPIERFPLLAPIPLHSSTIKAAKTPFSSSTKHSICSTKLLVRCESCLKGRFCNSCSKWWCEDCYTGSELQPTRPITRPPWNVIHDGSRLNKNPERDIKVHMGLCINNCLVREMMSGAGSNGMWG